MSSVVPFGPEGWGGIEPPRGGRAIAALAARQHGVVARRQLQALGVSGTSVDRLLADGRLHRVHRGVYAVGHPVLPRYGAYAAAALAGGDGALVSHPSAIALWELRPENGSRVHVTLPRRHRASTSRITFHRTRALHDDEITSRHGIAVTSVARSLVDYGATRRFDEVKRAWDEADYLGLLDLGELEAVLSRSNGRRGAAFVSRLVRTQAEPERWRSELERRLLALARRSALGRLEINAEVEGFECDALWRAERVIVEVDGFRAHRTRRAFQRDRDRDRVLTLAGYRVVRFTWADLRDRPELVAATIRALLRGGPVSPHPSGPGRTTTSR